eukprot:4263243-Pleurochrysis_carterae.AAC.2
MRRVGCHDVWRAAQPLRGAVDCRWRVHGFCGRRWARLIRNAVGVGDNVDMSRSDMGPSSSTFHRAERSAVNEK